jgi:LAO/AO transport system kinase
MLGLGGAGGNGWQPPIVKTVGTTGEGVGRLADEVYRHRDHLRRSGEGERRERERAQTDLTERLRERLYERWQGAAATNLAEMARRVAARECSPEEAVEQLLTGN